MGRGCGRGYGVQRLADENGFGAGVGIAIVRELLGESHLKRRIVIGKRGVLAEDITETQSVLMGEAIERAKINALTRQRIPKQKGQHPLPWRDPRGSRPADYMRALPSSICVEWFRTTSISYRTWREDQNSRAADMLDPFGNVAQQRFETVATLEIEAWPVSIIGNDLDERPHLRTSGLGPADGNLVHAQVRLTNTDRHPLSGLAAIADAGV